jgi:hypothetical protein
MCSASTVVSSTITVVVVASVVEVAVSAQLAPGAGMGTSNEVFRPHGYVCTYYVASDLRASSAAAASGWVNQRLW